MAGCRGFTVLIGLMLLAGCTTEPVPESPLEFPEVRITRSLSYDEGDVAILDLYEPFPDDRSVRALVLLAPGGGFNYCIPAEMEVHAAYLARWGFVAASIRYRVDGDHTTRTGYLRKLARATSDMRSAVRYFRRHQRVYRIDPERILLVGHSAGSMVALHTAFLRRIEEIGDEDFLDAVLQTGGLEGDGGHAGFSSEVIGVINLSGAITDLEFMESGESFILSIHGTDDQRIPSGLGIVETTGGTIRLFGSEMIHPWARQEAVGLDSRLIMISGGDHRTSMDSLYLEAIRDFILTRLR